MWELTLKYCIHARLRFLAYLWWRTIITFNETKFCRFYAQLLISCNRKLQIKKRLCRIQKRLIQIYSQRFFAIPEHEKDYGFSPGRNFNWNFQSVFPFTNFRSSVGWKYNNFDTVLEKWLFVMFHLIIFGSTTSLLYILFTY